MDDDKIDWRSFGPWLFLLFLAGVTLGLIIGFGDKVG